MAISTTAGIFRKSGDTLDYTPAAAVAAGKIMTIAGCNCLALWPIAANEAGSLKILHKGEVVELTTDEAIGATNAGTALYVDSNGLVTKTSTSNTLLGYAAAAIGATDITFQVICA